MPPTIKKLLKQCLMKVQGTSKPPKKIDPCGINPQVNEHSNESSFRRQEQVTRVEEKVDPAG